LRPVGRHLLGLARAVPLGRPPHPHGRPRPQRRRPVRPRPALRRLQGQRHRPPERHRRFRAVPRDQVRGVADPMTVTSESGVYYDPYDFEIDADPYPVWKRMRDEAPLYYNEKYDFFAVSRFDDVEKGLIDWDTYRSGRGSVLEIIKANIEIPPGSILFEDPPLSDVHRGMLSRLSTPGWVNGIETRVREFL